MKLKHKAIFVVIFLFIGNLKSQSTQFNLSDYRLPDFNFKSLDLNGELRQRNFARNISSNTNIPSGSDFSISGYGAFNFNSIKNDRTWQKNTSFSGSLSIIFDDKPFNAGSLQTYTRTRVNFKQVNRKYIKEDFFREINYDLSSLFS